MLRVNHLLLDAAGTLIHPAESVGAIYARYFAQAGIATDPDAVGSAFRAAFAAAPPPDYSLHPFGHAAEHAWWRALVHDILAASVPRSFDLAAFDEVSFDSLFEALFAHFAEPGAWRLFPDVLPFLEQASREARLAVVSNFDDRLPPILDGLGIGPYFEHVFTSAEARARKPDRALFELALDRLNCAPSDTAHAGDSEVADLFGATQAGVEAFLVKRPKDTLADFLEFCRG